MGGRYLVDRTSRPSEARVLHLIFGLLLEGADGHLGHVFAGVVPVQWEELKPLGVADGLLQLAGLVQQLLDGVVCLNAAALYHLWCVGEFWGAECVRNKIQSETKFQFLPFRVQLLGTGSVPARVC